MKETADQIQEARKVIADRIQFLRDSSYKVDNVQAILMEEVAGECATSEAGARIKAVAIYTLMQEWK